MEKLTEICTCDDNIDSPCPRHQRENELQVENESLKVLLTEHRAENTSILSESDALRCQNTNLRHRVCELQSSKQTLKGGE